MCGVYPASDVLTAGDQISSTYEGRHVTMRDDELIHKYTGATDDGFVDKGDAVILAKAGNGTHGWAVGVAFESGTASADLIAVDTEGIWALLVYADDDDGGSEVVPGDALYIDTSTAQEGAAGIGIGCLSKRRNLVTQIPFGYALGNITSTEEGVIAVKVHWDPEEQQEERIVFTGTTADDAKMFKVTDTQTNASGLARGLCVDYTQNGVKTGTAEVNALAVDLAVLKSVPYAYAQTIYIYGSSDPTVGLVAGLSLYIADCGDDIANNFCADLQFALTDLATVRTAHLRLRNHTAAVPTCNLFLQAGNNNKSATYFIDTGQNAESGPVYAAQTTTGTEVATYKIRCRYNATDFYLFGVASA